MLLARVNSDSNYFYSRWIDRWIRVVNTSDWFRVQDTAKDAISALITARPKTKLVNVPTLTCLHEFYTRMNFSSLIKVNPRSLKKMFFWNTFFGKLDSKSKRTTSYCWQSITFSNQIRRIEFNPYVSKV